jgi:hypothetical protein
VGFAGGKRKMWEREQGSVGGLDAGTIGYEDVYPFGDWFDVSVWAV